MRIDETEVPNTETNYYCQSFLLPHDEEYHIIADEVLFGNDNVLHHMILYVCEDTGIVHNYFFLFILFFLWQSIISGKAFADISFCQFGVGYNQLGRRKNISLSILT